MGFPTRYFLGNISDLGKQLYAQWDFHFGGCSRTSVVLPLTKFQLAPPTGGGAHFYRAIFFLSSALEKQSERRP